MTLSAFISLLQGAGVTVALSLLGIVLGVPLGLALALVRWARIPVLAQAIAAYVSVLRATPLITLGLLIFFALPSIGIPIDPIPAAILTLTLNTSAFNCEIWRGALIDFPRPQIEAAEATGMTASLAFRRVVFPQIWRTSLPALVNEVTLLVKASPAIAVIGVVDITRAAVRIGADTYEPLPPFLVATVLYFAVLFALVRVQRRLEAATVRKFGVA